MEILYTKKNNFWAKNGHLFNNIFIFIPIFKPSCKLKASLWSLCYQFKGFRDNDAIFVIVTSFYSPWIAYYANKEEHELFDQFKGSRDDELL